MPRSVFAAAFLLAMALIATPSPARADELLTNGSFESGVSAWSTSHGQLDPVSSPVHGGAQAARLSSSALQSHEVYRSGAVAPGEPYELSGWLLLNDPAIERVFLRIAWFSSGGSLISQTDSPWLTIPDSPYQALTTGEALSPLGAASARVGVRVQVTGSFTLYLDDFSFTGAVPPPSTPLPTPSGTPSPTSGPTATPSPAARTPSPTPRPSATAPPDEEPDVFDTLTNGGFETLRVDGAPYAWKEIGADLRATTSPVAEGGRALAVTSRSSSTKWAYETVRVRPGAFYEAAGYAWSGATAETFLRISWYTTLDGSGPATDSVDSTSVSPPGDRFERLSTGPIQAPIDARVAKVRLMLRPDSEAQIIAFFDAISFVSTIAHPSSGATAASAGRDSRTGGGRSGSTAITVAGASTGAPLLEHYPLGFVNVKPAPAAGPAAVSGGGAAYDWLAVLGVAFSLGVIAFAVFLEWSHRGRSTPDDPA